MDIRVVNISVVTTLLSLLNCSLGQNRTQRRLKIGVVVPVYTEHEGISFGNTAAAVNISIDKIQQDGLLSDFEFEAHFRREDSSPVIAAGKSIDLLRNVSVDVLIGPLSGAGINCLKVAFKISHFEADLLVHIVSHLPCRIGYTFSQYRCTVLQCLCLLQISTYTARRPNIGCCYGTQNLFKLSHKTYVLIRYYIRKSCSTLWWLGSE
ncbi:unnamed protein product [Toxocara canis]|uniref:ANF_receptor domain-containing protein n=1 Tax=Toxocara canis TaxID=6265 RepID=A0A183U5G6_TOXCA|nr:unnamed protein product [Toxocara canis]